MSSPVPRAAAEATKLLNITRHPARLTHR
jgi:hypothetical protein